MSNIFSLKVIVNRSAALLIFTMSFFISNVAADVEMIGADVPIMLKYKHDITPSIEVAKVPFERAFQIINRQPLVSGGSGGMPVWKNGYRLEEKEKNHSAVSEKMAEKIRYARVLELLYFIQLIQKSNH